MSYYNRNDGGIFVYDSRKLDKQLQRFGESNMYDSKTPYSICVDDTNTIVVSYLMDSQIYFYD